MTSLLGLIILSIACMGYGLLCLRLIRCPDAPSWAENYGRAFALGMGTLDVVTYSSRTLGISEKSKSKIFRINNEIK